MRIPAAVDEFIRAQGWGAVARAQPVGGGCINDGHCLTTAAGPRLFLKVNTAAAADMFEREAEGLAALAVPGGPRVPRPYLAGRDFILLEYLAAAPHAGDYWENLGRGLARVHAAEGAGFGFAHDNYIGSTPQPNKTETDGFKFFAEQRLLFQGQLAHRRGLLNAAALRRLERLAGRLRELVPAQAPSLIHGDLWSGNVISGPDGQACLIDPAAHYGWAEADLAMTALFGRFPDQFYTAYEAERPLTPGYRSRFDLYNLYHLLNHLNLFGGGYLGSVEAILARRA